MGLGQSFRTLGLGHSMQDPQAFDVIDGGDYADFGRCRSEPDGTGIGGMVGDRPNPGKRMSDGLSLTVNSCVGPTGRWLPG